MQHWLHITTLCWCSVSTAEESLTHSELTNRLGRLIIIWPLGGTDGALNFISHNISWSLEEGEEDATIKIHDFHPTSIHELCFKDIKEFQDSQNTFYFLTPNVFIANI